jgi:hypothetical protein
LVGQQHDRKRNPLFWDLHRAGRETPVFIMSRMDAHHMLMLIRGHRFRMGGL